MAPFGKVYSYPGNFRVQRMEVVAGINGLELESDPEFQMGVTNRSESFLAKFPMGKVPALECADGFCIAEGAAICMFLAGSGPKAEQLLGKAGDAKARATIAQWICFAENEIVANIMPVAAMVVFKFLPFEEARYNMHVANLERALKRLELALKGGNKFVVGDALSLADIMIAGTMFFVSSYLFDAEMKALVPEVAKYIQTLAAMPEFKPFGELASCETRLKA